MTARILNGELSGLVGHVVRHADGAALIRVFTPAGLTQVWVADGDYRT